MKDVILGNSTNWDAPIRTKKDVGWNSFDITCG